MAFLFLSTMLARVKFLLLYFLFWVLWFQLTRLLFLVYNYSASKELSATEKALSFVYGLRMDLSVAAYFLVPVCLFVVAGLFIPLFRKPLIYKIYSYLLLFFVLLITIADLEVYKSWGFRIDATPLRYLQSPKEAWASISHLPVFFILLVFLVIYFLLCLLVNKLIRSRIHWLANHDKKLGSALVLIVFTALLIIPIRGGLQLTPMNQSMVYYSKNNFANITALNATWNFLSGVVEGSSTDNPYNYLDLKKANSIVDSLYQSQDKTDVILKTANPNVIIIIWESFTKKATETLVEGKEITPRFNELKKQGIYFSNIYSSGDRTDKGLAAVLSSYPALNNFSIIRYPRKSVGVPTLAGFFRDRKYRTSFYYGGETEFANIKSYLLQSRFDRLTDKNNFASSDLNSKWGAHDGKVAEKITKDLQTETSPFFVSWLTLSSHEPFETPLEPYFRKEDNQTKFANAMHYTDGVIYDFVEHCSRQSWWQNTLLIIVADHGHHMIPPSTTIDNFKIPMLWLGGALNKQGVVIGKMASQIDLASSLTSQLNPGFRFSVFGKNIFDSTSKPWAYFSFNNGFGLMQPRGSFVFDNVGKQLSAQIGSITERDIDAGKAMQQKTYQDYLDR